VFRECPLLSLIEAVEAEGFGGGGVVALSFGDVQVAGVFDAAMIAARMVAMRLAGPLLVRLVAVSSLNVMCREWWCASTVRGCRRGGVRRIAGSGRRQQMHVSLTGGRLPDLREKVVHATNLCDAATLWVQRARQDTPYEM
jgi:hypothetical protein